MLPRLVRYLTVLVSAYAQVFDLFCQEQVKSKHERYANLQIQKSPIKITPDMLPWSISHLNNNSCREKQTNKQTNKQKRRQWLEMPFCSAIATILQHQDLLLDRSHFGIRVALVQVQIYCCRHSVTISLTCYIQYLPLYQRN